MPVAVTVNRKLAEIKTIRVSLTLVFSGTYPTGGESVDFSAYAGFTNRQPLLGSVNIVGKAGFVYSYDYANKKVMVFCNTAGGANGALTEHTAATYVAGVSGDTVYAYAEVPKG